MNTGGLVAPGGLPGSTARMARQPVVPSSPPCVRPGGPNGMAVQTRSAAEVFTPSREEIISFGGINESAAVGLRSSGRLRAQPNADASQLERAMLIAQRRDDLQEQGTSLPRNLSLLAFSDEDIVEKASSLGVSMGSSKKSGISAAKLIKENELQRALTILNKSDTVVDKEFVDSSNLLVSKASNLCEDLVDEENSMIDDQVEHLIHDTKKNQSRRKKSYDRSKVRRSTRIKLKRNVSQC
jgi:hypothetical protein